MLRLNCTRPRYRRWACNTGVKSRRNLVENEGLSDQVDGEFIELMRKKKGARLKEKVEDWKSRIDVMPSAHPEESSVVPSPFLAAMSDSKKASGVISTGVGSSKRRIIAKDTTDGNRALGFNVSETLGFPVVKHSNSVIRGMKPKQKALERQPRSSPQDIPSQIDDHGRQGLAVTEAMEPVCLPQANPVTEIEENSGRAEGTKVDDESLPKAISDVSETV
jgi:hypothetical protein